MARVTWRAALTLCVVAACAYYYGLVSADCVSPARLAEIERSLLVALRKSVDPLKRERDSLRAENAALRSTRLASPAARITVFAGYCFCSK